MCYQNGIIIVISFLYRFLIQSVLIRMAFTQLIVLKSLGIIITTNVYLDHIVLVFVYSHCFPLICNKVCFYFCSRLYESLQRIQCTITEFSTLQNEFLPIAASNAVQFLNTTIISSLIDQTSFNVSGILTITLYLFNN